MVLSGPGVGNNFLAKSTIRSRVVAEDVGCSYMPNDIRSTMECLRKIDAETLTNAYVDTNDNEAVKASGDALGTAPRVDGPGGIIPYPLDQLVLNRHPIPMLIGKSGKIQDKKIFL